jgi:hypothetical protein
MAEDRFSPQEKKDCKVVGVNVSGDGYATTSAQLLVRVQPPGEQTMTLIVTASAAPQFFAAVCATAIFAFEKQWPVDIKIGAESRLTYIGVERRGQ